MASLQYSDEAQNAINRFYGADTMVYVEGEDDVPFWEFIFENLAEYSVKVQSVGGKRELEKYIEKVVRGEFECITAMDSDFSDFDEFERHSNVLVTCGYSIENTLVTSKTIRDVIRVLGRLPQKQVSIEDCEEWLNNFSSDTEILVYHDLQNYILANGLNLSVSNCTRFLKSRNTPAICGEKIDRHLSDLGVVKDEDCFSMIKNKIQKHPSKRIGFVRGHFLFSAVLVYVSWFIKSIKGKSTVSSDALFGALMLSFEKHFDHNHEHYDHYKSEVNSVHI